MTLAAQWLGLALLSLALGAACLALHLPAALLLASMVAAIVFGANGASVRVRGEIGIVVFGVIGCLIATRITPMILTQFAQHGFLLVGVALASLVACTLLGLALTRVRELPGTTAIWGTSPGGAMAMILLSERYGADARLVAVMQYLRLVFVIFAAVAFSRLWLQASGAWPTTDWFAPIDAVAFAMTLVVALGGGWLGERIGIPAGALLLPLATALALRFGFNVTIALPEWFLALVYVAAGWRVGLGFTRQILRDALRVLPVVALSNVALIALCGGIAWLLTVFTGIDGLTAYLATSPGGIDAVAIIAVASHVDVGFVLAMQIVRFLIVLVLGARLAVFVANRLEPQREPA